MEALSNTDITVEHFEPAHQSLRIAVVTETWPPEVNGVAVTLSKLIHHLGNRHHSIQLIRPRQNKQDEGLEETNWTELLLRGLPIPRYPQLKLGLPSKKALIKAWSTRRPDLVHIATEGPLSWSALQAAHVLRLPVTSDFRTNFHSYCQHYGVGWLTKPIVAYLRKFHNRTAFTMVPTTEMKNQLEGMGFKNLKVVARGIDTQLFHPNKRSDVMRQSWHVKPETMVLLSVGRLAAEKNLDLSIQTYQALKAAGRDVKMVFAGDGPMRASTEVKCPDALFVGMCTHEQLATLYASADLLLFPSLTETFGNVTLESLACATPVLAFDCAAAGEFITHNTNGWLAHCDDRQGYIQCALEITKNSSILKQAREYTRSSIEHLGWDEIACQVETIFQRAIELN
ncbi:glycoside hydrolase [Limnohabitans sp. Jir61]|uniref:glycosyltransferase family 4 protein n=1 Tax=Limnohabitans sp. Jir61 TaxID=1826168 RepID=UPI000D369C1B|nr:glycosyltransferase family 1 protein [Limnohabitans sp. Jir61]PUE28856.1 glycoside hydrolase [Limnohabitans sp. Jir61]